MMVADNLIDTIYTCLTAEDPDVEGLVLSLHAQLGLSLEDVRQLVYKTVNHINLTLFPPITKLEVIHTDGCNIACVYCFEKSMLGVSHMPSSLAQAAVDLLFDYAGEQSQLSITHFGGEPLLNMPGVRLVTEYAEERARAAGKTISFDMTSNGILLSDSVVAYLAEHKISVLLSIDGLAPSHDRYRRDRGGQATYERVIQGLIRLKRRQPWIGVKMTVMPDNAANLFIDVVGLYRLGVNQFVIGEATGVKWTPAARACFEDQLIRLSVWYREAKPHDLRIIEFEEPASNKSVWGCQAGRDSIAISTSGAISPCSKILALNNQQTLAKLGDVHRGLTHLRNRQELLSCEKLRSNWSRAGHQDEYYSGCFVSNYDENRDLFQPSADKYAFAQLWRRVRATD